MWCSGFVRLYPGSLYMRAVERSMGGWLMGLQGTTNTNHQSIKLNNKATHQNLLFISGREITSHISVLFVL